jgi:hypothetical protein
MERTSTAIIAVIGGLALATAAGAQGQSGAHGGGGGAASSAGAGGAFSAGPSATVPSTGATTDNYGRTQRESARESSQGSTHASDTAKTHANANSALGVDTSATASALIGLKTGLTVKDSSGATLGTVSKIEKSKDGTVRSVLVASASGKTKTLHLAPGDLTVSGDVVTTTKTPH